MDKVMRQTDPNFRDVHQKARDGMMDDEAVDFLLRRHYSSLSTVEREAFKKDALFLMPTWKLTKQITKKYLLDVGNPIAVIKADEAELKYQIHLCDFSIPRTDVLMVAVRVQLQSNFIVELRLYNGVVGWIEKTVYADKQGPNAVNAPLPAYVVVNFPIAKIPADEAWDPYNLTWVPIPPKQFEYKLHCCRVTMMPLRIHKATSVHKGQGISCGKGMRDELVAVGLGGATASPGIDLVSLLRTTEISALAIYDDIDITREQLFKIGQGKGYDKKREFKSKLEDIQAKTVPPMITLIKSEDNSKEPTFSGGCQRLAQWFRSVQHALPPMEKQLDGDALEKASTTFLDSLEETSSENSGVKNKTKISSAAKKVFTSSNKHSLRKSVSATKRSSTRLDDVQRVVCPDRKKALRSTAKHFSTCRYTRPLNDRETLELAFNRFTEVPGDGNCGYYVIQKYLEQKGLSAACDNGNFRKALRQYGIDHLDTLIVADKYFDRNISVSHTTLTNRQKQTRVMKRLDEIWNPRLLFDNGCDSTFWMFEDIAFPLAVLKWKINVVLYSDYNAIQGSGTTCCTYDGIQDDVKRTYQEEIVLPDTIASNMLYYVFVNVGCGKIGNH
jgi:hypothetical protein